tara:strand:- start:41 stop:613 length:573 start_codon:yes stop_codon:yes gene_type:complete
MATFTLTPDGSSGHTFHWANVGGTNHHTSLQTNDGDTSYVQCSATGRQLILTYVDPAVAESSIASITSVQFLSTGRHTGRIGTADVDISFETPTAGFSETAVYNAHHSSYTTINGTVRTTSDGSSAWTYSDLENLSMKLTKNGSNQVRVSYLALKVTYVEAGYSNTVNGVSNISKVNGIATADISKVNGV